MSADSVAHPIAASDAPKGKGGTAEAARPIQEKAMLNVAERPGKGKIDPSRYIDVSPDTKAALWLDEQVANSQSAVTTQVAQLTPDLARVLLARNPNNRPISEAIVSNYVRDIDSGAWRFNGEPLIVAKDGQLNDGQHRCMAVILSGKSIPVPIIVGVERDTRTTLDQGRIRTAGDYLAMEGHTYSNGLAVAAKMVWQWQKFDLVSQSAKYRPTKSELLAIVEATPRLERSCAVAARYNIAAVGSVGMLAFCHFAMSVASNAGEVEAFLAALSTGENLPAASPILYARNRLLAEKARMKVGERAELIFKAWNSYRRGESIKAIQLTGEKLPMLES